ncbi:MAG: hypothetical protein ACRCUT_11145 [Spirochaetota bacterium]
MDGIADIDEKKTVKAKDFVPTTISESIKITPSNEDKIALIETEGSPALQSDLDYILATGHRSCISGFFSRMHRFFTFQRQVTTEYFLTYHQRDEDELPARTAAGKKGKQKRLCRYIGDEILHLIRFNETFSNKPFLLFITDFEVGGTRYNRDFLQREGYIPLERFIGKESPKWILIGAGPGAGIREVHADSGTEKFLIIPSKINFRFWDRIGLAEYEGKLYSSSQFLRKYPAIRRSARESNVETVILISEKILVLERKDSSWTSIGKICFTALKRHRDIALTLSGAFFFNLGSGIQQGAIINPILNMMDAFGILILLTWLMQYIYPNIVNTLSVILSADRFDKLKSAEKDEYTEPALINLELKKILSTVGIYSTISVVLLMAIYPGFFMKDAFSSAAVKWTVALVYIASAFFRDWSATFEQDALFRILKRSLSGDAQLYKSILKINAFAYSGSIFLNLVGIAIGWLAMNTHPVLGIALAAAGVLMSLTKFLYPWRGTDFTTALSMNVSPFYGTEHEIVVIPDKVMIHSVSPIRIHAHGRNRVIYDNANFEIIVHDPEFIPAVKERKNSILSPVCRTWTLEWKTGAKTVKVKISLKNRKQPFSLQGYRSAGMTKYCPVAEYSS